MKRKKKKKGTKDMIRVLDAVNLGAETSAEVQAVTGLPIAHCSVWLGELAALGQIRLVKKDARKYNSHGRCSHLYFPLTGRLPPIDVGPLSFVPTENSYISPSRAIIERRRAGFVRADTLVAIPKSKRNATR